ncbi:hypothetical protein C5167_005212 [Papaver somniferum]|uniref:Uncharacterized protein n=1 Tax=Papaver somniferum TaxID=3469 RepID=A0A4Y7JBL3_PAPSO|nr:hypothetical protein C5167_005212 [Papaver somniferum]
MRPPVAATRQVISTNMEINSTGMNRRYATYAEEDLYISSIRIF